ncbi:MAG: c-type cytochrome [Archangium sp.]|nr:c-type cytochrome [Archangium sp.]
MLMGALAASMAFSGCKPEGNAAAARASGSVALTNDDSEILAVDTDNGWLMRFSPETKAMIGQPVKVGERPVRVIVDANDTAFVANRGSRSVSVVRKGDTQESLQIAVGVEPTGMALTPDGKTLLVVSATALDKTETGLLTAIDTNTLDKKWEIEIGEEPRAVAVIAGNRALVSLFKQGEVVTVDLGNGSVVPSNSDATIYKTANATRVQGGNSFGVGSPISSFRPRAISDLVVTPDGDRVFAPITWAREDNIGRPPSASAGGYYAAGGPCNIGSVATAGIVTVDTAAAPTPQVDDLTSCFTGSGTVSADKDFPVSTLSSSDTSIPAMQGPTVAALDPTGEWLVVVNRETRNMAWMPAWKRAGTKIDVDSSGSSIRSVQDLGVHGVDGIALSKDGSFAFVYSQFDHKLVAFKGHGKDEGATIAQDFSINVTDLSAFGADRELVEARKLFFDAKDDRMSSNRTNVACASCHLEGREDGHVWQFPDGSRQTPSLAGRKLLSTAPFHWSGEFASISQFNLHTITERMGGKGLDPATAAKLDRFIDIMPLPENPLRTAMQSDQLRAGQAAFEKAQCASCHTGDVLTNNQNEDVGTLRLSGTNPDNGVVTRSGFNVPSLLGIGRTAPYLHDGSSLTLSSRVFNNDARHGNTALLNETEKADLLAYLRSL